MGDFTIMGLPISIGTMIYQALIFTILTFLLKKFVLRKLVNVMDQRKLRIESQLQIAEKYRHDAEQNLETSSRTLKQARKEAIEMLTHSEQEAELIIKDAKVEARKILAEAKKEALLFRAQLFNSRNHNKGA